jgi:SAM-dependent methyltransferase
MSAMERLQREREFHDHQASLRATTFHRQPERLWVDDALYVRHESWIDYGMRQLGDVAGARLLDFGCGHAMASVVLARRGARVTAFDLSFGYVAEAAKRAEKNSVNLELVQADGASLPFADGAFDRVWGNAVLHHLDIDVAGREVRRVLRPGGIAVFCEPWGGNPLVNWARRHVSDAGKRTADEEPLCYRHLKSLQTVFPQLESRGFQLLGMIRRICQREKILAGLNWCDSALLSRVRTLERFCRYVVVTLRG